MDSTGAHPQHTPRSNRSMMLQIPVTLLVMWGYVFNNWVFSRSGISQQSKLPTLCCLQSCVRCAVCFALCGVLRC